jgi:hypothetical protein
MAQHHITVHNSLQPRSHRATIARRSSATDQSFIIALASFPDSVRGSRVAVGRSINNLEKIGRGYVSTVEDLAKRQNSFQWMLPFHIVASAETSPVNFLQPTKCAYTKCCAYPSLRRRACGRRTQVNQIRIIPKPPCTLRHPTNRGRVQN